MDYYILKHGIKERRGGPRIMSKADGHIRRIRRLCLLSNQKANDGAGVKTSCCKPPCSISPTPTIDRPRVLLSRLSQIRRFYNGDLQFSRWQPLQFTRRQNCRPSSRISNLLYIQPMNLIEYISFFFLTVEDTMFLLFLNWIWFSGISFRFLLNYIV